MYDINNIFDVWVNTYLSNLLSFYTFLINLGNLYNFNHHKNRRILAF